MIYSQQPLYEKKGLDDVGTRYTHLAELRDMWEEGITIINGYSYRTKEDMEKLAKLTISAQMVTKALDMLSEYLDNVYTIRQAVNIIGKDASKIPYDKCPKPYKEWKDGMYNDV